MKEHVRELFDWYIENQDTLLKEHNGRYLVISDFKVVKSTPTLEEAIDHVRGHLKPGSYLIQKCSEGDRDYTATFVSRRAVFA